MQHAPLRLPLYQRVFEVLDQRIRAGVYPVGTALSTEEQLAAEFKVSKATIRQAVGALVERGIVERQQGKGTFVCQDGTLNSTHMFVGSLADLIFGSPSLALRDVSVTRKAPFPTDVQAILGPGNDRGTILRHHRDLDDTPFSYVVQYVSTVVDRYLSADEFSPTGRLLLLRERGMAVKGARQSVSARLADLEVAEHVGCDIGAPVLFAERIVESVEGPIEVIRVWYRGDLYKWETELVYSDSENGIRMSVAPHADLSGVTYGWSQVRGAASTGVPHPDVVADEPPEV